MAQTSSAGEPIKVVVIDDSETVRRSATMLLEGAGYKVFTADNGFEAMALIYDKKPDIVFVDIVMPRLDGYQTCSLLKRNRRFSGLPVIMLSARDGLFDRARAKIAGSSEHLNKPFSQQQLVDAVNRYVRPSGPGGGEEVA